MKKSIRIEVSVRHVYLTKHDLEILFGEGHELKRVKDLSQPGQFVSADMLTLVGLKNSIENVRVLGPCRGNTQIEISRTDCLYLGSAAPLRLSGKIIGSGNIKLVGPKAELTLKEGLIVAKRHLNINNLDVKEMGLSVGQNVSVQIDGSRAVIFKEVEVCVVEDSEPVVYLDIDEASAAGINENIGECKIV